MLLRDLFLCTEFVARNSSVILYRLAYLSTSSRYMHCQRFCNAFVFSLNWRYNSSAVEVQLPTGFVKTAQPPANIAPRTSQDCVHSCNMA